MHHHEALSETATLKGNMCVGICQQARGSAGGWMMYQGANKGLYCAAGHAASP